LSHGCRALDAGHTTWPGSVDDYVDALVWLVGELLTDPKHFFRSFTVKELGRLMTDRPAVRPDRHRPKADRDPRQRLQPQEIKEGSLIRFRCQGDQVLTRVTRVARYTGFEEMFDRRLGQPACHSCRAVGQHPPDLSA
jgi:hypothetical protein